MSAQLPQGDRLAMTGRNKLKFGLFGANCSSGRACTTVEERWSGSWDDCLALAKMADRAGLDFMLPVGRWRGWGGTTDYHGATLETITWATALLAHTSRIFAFGTVHAPLFHPLIAAKQLATADHVGSGRFGLNLVCGWNEGEFEMFGVTQRDHEARYAYAQEWLDVVRACWGPKDDFRFDGEYIQVKDVRSKPKPYGGSRPLIMNAGVSGTGQAFAVKNCDAIFIATSQSIDDICSQIEAIRAKANESRRELDVYMTGVITCRPTKKDAEEYHHYVAVERVDWGAVDTVLQFKNITRENTTLQDYEKARRKFANGLSAGYTLVGDPDHIAGEMAKLSRAGVNGVAASFVNYLSELPYFCEEVLPRLERLGVRSASKDLAVVA
jgi:FMNH2-dependent dimethyl sulfone monooxygenase